MLTPETPYGITDSQTGTVVYRTTWKRRNMARRWADKKDLEYGVVRYSSGILSEKASGIPCSNMHEFDKVMGG